ncbi:hypothetical protein B0T20DRAFT_476956 [Sordaria brevicollis]|uniref:Uncharacterized protein n=1 Tax=Sordaria brevicollis TaxID=83679 RepID=A0AAE0PJ88_SORBR|nr:hypothetical protein B0T20DRAFT_476956 [Sordaria brevicollis]
MNGLRTLASKEDTLRNFLFLPDRRYDNATVMELVPDLQEPGANRWLSRDSVDDLRLADFLEHGGSALSSPNNGVVQGENSGATHGTKLVVVARQDTMTILMDKSIFQDILQTISPDPLHRQVFHAGYYRTFDASGSIANGGTVTMQIRVWGFWFMLSICQHKDDPATFDSRCVAPRAVDEPELPLSDQSNHLLACLEHLKEEACSPLYLPFALSVHGVYASRDVLTDIGKGLASLQRTTTWGRLDNQDAYATGLLNGLESLWHFLVEMAGDVLPEAKTDRVVQSTNNILDAISLLRQEAHIKREVLRDRELRFWNQAALISAYVSQQDSETNIKTATSSHKLAEAATADSSAMKSIAILTMFFLPSTFFAALFVIPSFG